MQRCSLRSNRHEPSRQGSTQAGLYAAGIKCTVPAIAEAAIGELESFEEFVPATATEVGASLAVVAAALATGKTKIATLKALDSSEDVVRSTVWGAKKSVYLPVLAKTMDRVTLIESKLNAEQVTLAKEAAAKKAAQEKAEGEASAAAKAKAERQAANDRAAEKLAEEKSASEPRQIGPKVSTPAPEKQKKYNSGNGSYPGYTGPRCYAPGGQSWKPCKD